MPLPEVISAILTGLAGIVTAVGGIYTIRRKNIDADASANYKELLSLRKDNKRLRRKEILFLRWIHDCEVEAAEKGIDLPDMPGELRALLNDADNGEATGPPPVINP